MRTFVNYSTFLAFYDFEAAKHELIVTLKNGRRYLVAKFNRAKYNELQAAKGAGSYMLHQVFKNDEFPKTEIERMTAKKVSEIIQDNLNKRNFINKYRPVTGWNAFLAQ